MKEITVDANIETVAVVTEFVNQELEEVDCPPKLRMQIDVVIDEIFSNIAQYAYDGKTGKASVCVEFEDGNEVMVLTFKDSGKPYNPLENKEPDVTLSAEERPIGGLGIFMVKKMMDAVQYEYKECKNILQVKKRLKN
ncbi:ATP-binding protein [Eubacterium oxidoreducens]|uniref:Anti-sigma regulatory factor (Ser/Thr protein kinase) n=1 Tax=Eubacterium oxidoreducens TaxID=1732 RepID=A0A1G6AAT3_EUBOX|nr:ATP-binding protein [Eubacterium oxidoreducens]SDB05426.1 Anti-sigma regulatory factor (Ser/Thr protein kinase) [Eubacterium oxidoreducens]